MEIIIFARRKLIIARSAVEANAFSPQIQDSESESVKVRHSALASENLINN